MASMPMQPIDPDSRIALSQLPYERGYAAGVAETEAKYADLVVAAAQWLAQAHPTGEAQVTKALRQLEEKP